MSEQPQPDQNQIDARRYQQAFDLYALSLTFTILALSIQTASFGECAVRDSIELLAWLALLFSGLCGLNRGLWTPNLFNLFGSKPMLQDQMKHARSEYYQNKEIIDPEEDPEQLQASHHAMKEAEKAVQLAEKIIYDVTKKIETCLEIQKYCFFLGVIALVIARAYLPIAGIVKAIRASCS